MKITKQARRDAKSLFRACLDHGRLDEGRARQAVAAVIKQKPRGYQAILSHFLRLVKLETARRTARIESATDLSPEMRTSVERNLARIYGEGLNISFQQRPDLIGGLRIHVGSDVYDGSVRARLAALEESF